MFTYPFTQKKLGLFSRIGHFLNKPIFFVPVILVKTVICFIGVLWMMVMGLLSPLLFWTCGSFSEYIDKVAFYPIYYRGTSVSSQSEFKHIFDWASNS